MDDPDSPNRLIISMPPQEGKSSRVSQRFPEWLLDHNPDLRIAIISYSDDLARGWGAAIKMDVLTHNGIESAVDLKITLREDSKAAGRWNIRGHKGSVFCAGIGGSVTGKPVDIFIIDDPIKDLEQAQSSIYRDRFRKFWQAVAIPRLGPSARCVVIQTRWHEDDAAGWLQVNEPDKWRVINIPAQAGVEETTEDVHGRKVTRWVPTSEPDPLGRQPGEYMISARGARDWAGIRRDVGSYVWSALYQGRPAPAAGGLFKRANLRYWQVMPRDISWHGLLNGMRVDLGGRVVMLDQCWRFLTVDLAASTKTSADWTVAGAFAISPDGDLILLDGIRVRVEESNHWNAIRPLREKWSADVVYVESRMFGTTMVYEAGRSGVPIQELKADTDKLTRALPATARSENGRLWLPPVTSYPEVLTWVNELVSFPNASHDDCVDVISYAARVSAANWLSQTDTQSLTRNRPKVNNRSIENAYESATGYAGTESNYETMQW
jgi:predicted phage terminase large subunit-like protein